jgi:hypothetical protein
MMIGWALAIGWVCVVATGLGEIGRWMKSYAPMGQQTEVRKVHAAPD